MGSFDQLNWQIIIKIEQKAEPIQKLLRVEKKMLFKII